MKLPFMLMLLCLLLPLVASWGFESHLWLCEQIYDGNKELQQMLDKKEFLRGCNAPDVEIKDQRYHNCYMAKECKEINVTRTAPATLTYFSDINDCYTGKALSCHTLERFNQSLDQALVSNFSYYVGAAVHYYSDAFVPLHQVTGEDYWKCHSPFENKIDDKLVHGERFWTVTQECTFYFPCRATAKTIRKCQNNYTANITFSYENMVEVVRLTDNAISNRLNISSGDYSYLVDKKPTGFFVIIFDKIINFIKSIFS